MKKIILVVSLIIGLFILFYSEWGWVGVFEFLAIMVVCFAANLLTAHINDKNKNI